MQNNERIAPDPLLTSELLAVQDHVSRLLNNLQSLGSEAGLDGEAEALKIVQDKLHAALTQLSGPNAAKLSLVELRSLIAEAAAATHRAAPTIAAASSASIEAQMEMQHRIAAYRDGEQSMRDIYDRFEKERTTPADPALQLEERDARQAYQEALKSGDERRIARTVLELDQARLRNLAYAVGRGDPKAPPALADATKQADKRYDHYSTTERAHGAPDDKVSADIQALRAKHRDRLREALEKGAKDAGRSLPEEELGQPAGNEHTGKRTEAGRADTLSPKVRAEVHGADLSREIKLAEANPAETQAPAVRGGPGKEPAQVSPT